MARESASLALTRRLFSRASSTAWSMVSGPSTRGNDCAQACDTTSRANTENSTTVARPRNALVIGMSTLPISFGLEFELRRRRSTAGRSHVDLHGPGARHAQVHGRFIDARIFAKAGRYVRTRHSRHPCCHVDPGVRDWSASRVLDLDAELCLADPRRRGNRGETDLETAGRAGRGLCNLVVLLPRQHVASP